MLATVCGAYDLFFRSFSKGHIIVSKNDKERCFSYNNLTNLKMEG